jgi:hypothetical protein
MTQTHWLRGLTVVLMSGLLLLLAVGCNESADFDPRTLFSIEDYAQDQDYAINTIGMMNSWRMSLRSAQKQLDTNVDGLSFLEAVPPEWTQNDPSDQTALWYFPFLSVENQWLDDQWYYRSYQDAAYEFTSINRDVPAGTELNPAQAAYMRLSFLVSPLGGTFAVGDSVSVEYADDFTKESELRGDAMFWNSDAVQASSAPTDLASYASMSNVWGGSITNMTPDPNNPQGDFDISGVTQIVRADLLEQATLGVQINASIRSNGRGEATIVVAGETRAEIVFVSYDTRFHGYILLSSSGFREQLHF